jgi:hypothetical protein
VLARHEGEFRGEPQQPLSLNELLALLGEDTEGEGRSREDAIACYLSGGDGWREAVKKLGGTFADEDTGLREHKAD